MNLKNTAPKSRTSSNIFLYLIMSLTLGLMPFFPEPHLFGKLRWVAGGAHGMAAMDWFDLALHGFPWLLLAYALISEAKKKFIN